MKDGDKEILELAIQRIELVRLANAAWKLQQNVLGRSDKNQVAQIVVQFGNTEEEDEDAEDVEATQSNGARP